MAMGISMGRSSRSIARAKAAAEKAFMDSANARANQLGISLPSNFYVLSQLQVNQKTQYPSKSFTGSNLVDSYANNKNAFVTNAVKNAGYNYAYMSYGRTSAPDQTATDHLKSAATTAVQMGIPVSTVQNEVLSGAQQFGGSIPKDDLLTKIGGYVAPLAMAYLMPQVGASIGSALTNAGVISSTTVANAVGTALASTAAQVAQGADFETALKNATVNAIVQTGSPAVATEINKVVGIPAVTDAITSAGASGIQTALTGGSLEDVKKNMTAALAGSAASSATDSRLTGAAVGGAVTGGTAGALSNLAGEYGSQTVSDQSKLEAQKGTKLASADTGTVSDVPSLSPVVVTATQPSIADTDIILPPTTKPVTTPPTTPPTPDQKILDLIKTDVTTPPKTEVPSLRETVVTAPKETTIQDTDIIVPETKPTVPETKTTDTKGTEPLVKEEPVKEAPSEEPVSEEAKPKEGLYKPNLFIYSGKSPQVLSQALGTSLQGGTTTGITTGLAGERGAGEIETKETGKKRKNVWNEASLRLKDALGV